jgi:hypothetical protein
VLTVRNPGDTAPPLDDVLSTTTAVQPGLAPIESLVVPDLI